MHVQCQSHGAVCTSPREPVDSQDIAVEVAETLVGDGGR